MGVERGEALDPLNFEIRYFAIDFFQEKCFSFRFEVGKIKFHKDVLGQASFRPTWILKYGALLSVF